MAQSLHNYFQNPKNLEILDKLKRGGVEFPVEETGAGEAPLAGKTFVLTGGLDTLTRDEARSLIQEQGGRVSSSVSKKTDFVIVGKDAGSKLDKARKLGVDNPERGRIQVRWLEGRVDSRRVPWKYRYVSRDARSSVLSRAPSPICLGSVSPSPCKVARRKSPTEPWTAPNNSSFGSET